MAGLSYSDASYLQYLKTLGNRVNDALNSDDAQGQNTVIQFFDAPYEQVNLGGTVITSTHTDPSINMVWASSTVTSSFTWDTNGQWDSLVNGDVLYDDVIYMGASSIVTSFFASDFVWGDSSTDTYWSWSFGGQYDPPNVSSITSSQTYFLSPTFPMVPNS